jgi:hypothetical protein
VTESMGNWDSNKTVISRSDSGRQVSNITTLDFQRLKSPDVGHNDPRYNTRGAFRSTLKLKTLIYHTKPSYRYVDNITQGTKHIAMCQPIKYVLFGFARRTGLSEPIWAFDTMTGNLSAWFCGMCHTRS